MALAREALEHGHGPVRRPLDGSVAARAGEGDCLCAVITREVCGPRPCIQLQRRLMDAREQRRIVESDRRRECPGHRSCGIIAAPEGLLQLRTRHTDADHQIVARDGSRSALRVVEQRQAAGRIARARRELCKMVQQSRARLLVTARVGQRKRALPAILRAGCVTDAQTGRCEFLDQRRCFV